MKLTKHEQETIVLFNEAEPAAEIYTYNAKQKKRLLRFENNREVITEINIDSIGAMRAVIPKNLLTISVRATYSEQERQARSERARQKGYLPQNPPKLEAI